MGEEERTIMERPFLLLLIVIVSCVVFLTPLVNMVNSMLTWLAVQTGLNSFIRGTVLPVIVGVVAVMLRLLGFETTVLNYRTVIFASGGHTTQVTLLWNCIGWQSLLVVFVTLVVGLSGSYTTKSKAICITLAYEVAFLMSVLRILLVCLIAFSWGARPAVLFHDWGGTVFTLVWILLFWLLSFKKILVRKAWSLNNSQSPIGFEMDEEMGT